jgi:AcrR family transcriptional regulator
VNEPTTTKEKIERSTIVLIAERGVDGVSMRDIARLVGVSEPAVYRHFVNKNALVWEVFTTHYDIFAAQLARLQAPHANLKNKLCAMVAHCCFVFDTDYDLFTFLLLAQHVQRGATKEYQAALPELLKTLIEEAIERNEIPQQDPAVAAAMVMGCVLHCASYCLYQKPVPRKMGPLSSTLSTACWNIVQGERHE